MISRILTPTEWEKLKANLNPYYQIICEAMLHTGLRTDSEFWRFVENPQWYHRGKITIPYINSLQQARTIPLSIKGREAVEILIAFTRTNNKRKEKNTVRDALRRAASGDGRTTARIDGRLKKVNRSPVFSTDGVNANMLRKTFITWLVYCYPEKKYEILIAMGIDEENFGQYIGKKTFEKKEFIKMRVYLEGWVKR